MESLFSISGAHAFKNTCTTYSKTYFYGSTAITNINKTLKCIWVSTSKSASRLSIWNQCSYVGLVYVTNHDEWYYIYIRLILNNFGLDHLDKWHPVDVGETIWPFTIIFTLMQMLQMHKHVLEPLWNWRRNVFTVGWQLQRDGCSKYAH